MPKYIIVVVLLAMLCTSVSAESKRQPLRAMAYSLIIPGGGQLYNQQYVKASVVLGVQCYLIKSVYEHESDKADFQRLASESTGVQQSLYQAKVYEYRDLARNDYWWIGTTLLLSIADAFVDAHLYDFQIQRKKVHLLFSDAKLGLGIEF